MPRTTRRSAVPAAVLGVVGAVLTLGGCSQAEPSSSGASGTTSPSSASSSPSSSAPASPSSSAPASPSASSDDVRTIDIAVQGKKVTPTPARVEIASGETLRLVVTADHDDELHADGFEVEKELKAGVPTTVDLPGAEPGLYEVETHHPELRLLQVLV